MKQVSIILKYPEASKYYRKWAMEEEKVDFTGNIWEATRCTVSFAAEELCVYLNKLGMEAKVCDMPGIFNIWIEAEAAESEVFDIETVENGIILKGTGRAGALYAVYELLEAQGIRWYAPELEYVPQGISELKIPKKSHFVYSMPKGRGFHTEGLQKESRKLMLWMARNRMNLHSCHSHSVKYQQKLCMHFSAGGHVFHSILDPNNVEEDGRLYIDAHKDWYGKRDGEITAGNAQRVQFCATNEELLDRMAEVIVERAKYEWKNEEIYEVAGFDTWGNSCNCDACRALGNGSDITLHYLSHIRKRIDEATDRGEINHKIYLCFDAYEGTDTLQPPLNPVPENLIAAGDYALYCPIKRCYQHDIYDTDCDRNVIYKETFEGWVKSGMAVSINEYYNVSRFEDMPLLFTKRIYNDVRYYMKHGAERLVYMHVPMVEWGVCTTTQYLLANICRDADCDYFGLLDGYFKDIFGAYANRAKEAYEKAEKALELCASYRSWGADSTLGKLNRWDGKMPEKPFAADSHFEGDPVGKGRETVRLLNEAVEILRGIRKEELAEIAKYQFAQGEVAVNPIEERKMQSQTVLIDKLCEDIRGLLYGIDMIDFITLLVEYYETLYEKDFQKAKAVLNNLEELGTRISEDTYGVSFLEIPDFEVRNVLMRTRLKALYYKCLANRGICG